MSARLPAPAEGDRPAAPRRCEVQAARRLHLGRFRSVLHPVVDQPSSSTAETGSQHQSSGTYAAPPSVVATIPPPTMLPTPMIATTLPAMIFTRPMVRFESISPAFEPLWRATAAFTLVFEGAHLPRCAPVVRGCGGFNAVSLRQRSRRPRERCGSRARNISAVIEAALTGGTHDGREHLLGVGALAGAVAAAHLADDHRGADGLFGPPVGGVYRGVAQEEEHGREFGGEMLGEALGVLQRRRRVDQPTRCRASSRPRSESRPCRVSSPFRQRSRRSRPVWRTALTFELQGL